MPLIGTLEVYNKSCKTEIGGVSMAVWYEVVKSENGIENFLMSNWGFHDFRPERVSYIPGKDMAEIFLKYDSGTEGVLIRFSGIFAMHTNTDRDYDAEWLNGAVMYILEDGNFIWLDDDSWGDSSFDHLEEIKEYTTWIKSERVFWAITDRNGNPIEMPKDRIDQKWHNSMTNETTEYHFVLRPFTGKWEEILLPEYKRRK